MCVITPADENTRCIAAQLISVIGLPTVGLGPEGNGYRIKGVAVVLEMFESVNGSREGALVRQALAAPFETEVVDPAAPENE
jgi:hypothetical protein